MKPIRLDYMGGRILLRPAGRVEIEGKMIDLKDAIKIERGNITSMLPFEAFAAIVEEARKNPDVMEWLQKFGVDLRKGIF